MSKIKDPDDSFEGLEKSTNEPTTSSVAGAIGLPTSESAEYLFGVFERSVEKLGPVDREAVLEQQSKLMRSFSLLGEKIGEILSSEEGRRLLQQELKNRERSKK